MDQVSEGGLHQKSPWLLMAEFWIPAMMPAALPRPNFV